MQCALSLQMGPPRASWENHCQISFLVVVQKNSRSKVFCMRTHILRECHARSAHTVRSFDCRPILRRYFWPLLTSIWFHTRFFFSFLCIWDVAHLNCHPLLPNVNHFYPFSIPHIELSPLWEPREGRGDVAIHSPRTLRSLWYSLHPHHITDLARHQQVCRVHAQNHHRPPLHPIRGPHHRPRTTHSPRSESRDTSSPPPRAKPWAPKHSKQADFTRLSGLFIGTVEYQVEGSFVVLMWALLLCCATNQVTGILG